MAMRLPLDGLMQWLNMVWPNALQPVMTEELRSNLDASQGDAFSALQVFDYLNWGLLDWGLLD